MREWPCHPFSSTVLGSPWSEFVSSQPQRHGHCLLVTHLWRHTQPHKEVPPAATQLIRFMVNKSNGRQFNYPESFKSYHPSSPEPENHLTRKGQGAECAELTSGTYLQIALTRTVHFPQRTLTCFMIYPSFSSCHSWLSNSGFLQTVDQSLSKETENSSLSLPPSHSLSNGISPIPHAHPLPLSKGG